MTQLPKYCDLYLPVLNFLSNSKKYSIREIRDNIAQSLDLKKEQLDNRLKSGQTVFDNRLRCAVTHLTHAKLLDRPERAIYCITNQGIETCNDNPNGITFNKLYEIPEFKAWHSKAENDYTNNELTPEENIEQRIEQINNQLKDEVLERMRTLSARGFEQLVLYLLVGMGYGSSMADVQGVPRGADGGVDGFVNQDYLGLDKVYIQAKRWTSSSVKESNIRDFHGALSAKGASKGVFMTTSTFTEHAQRFNSEQRDKRIVLIDGKKMAELMLKHKICLPLKQSFSIQRIDEDFFTNLEA